MLLRYRNASTYSSSGLVAQEAKNSFLSIVRRARVNQDQGVTKKFVEYEIACQMRAAGTRVEKEIVYKWSCWKRYTDFGQLHKNLQKDLGWLLQKIDLPPSHTFVFDKFSADFIEQRR